MVLEEGIKMKDALLKEPMFMPDISFPVKVSYLDLKDLGGYFSRHWHEHMEFLYFLEGQGRIECENNEIEVSDGDLLVINSNEIHGGHLISESLKYYCIIVDIGLLQNNLIGNSEAKYIIPIRDNRILFKNQIQEDEEIISCAEKIIKEYEIRQEGYELLITSYIYQIIALLLREHVAAVLTEKNYELRKKRLIHFSKVLQYIDKHYEQDVDIEFLAKMAHISTSHFYPVFKEITGKTPTHYINFVRIEKAEELLKNSEMNVTEVAFTVGFNDLSYFCRLFKRYKGISPSAVRNSEC